MFSPFLARTVFALLLVVGTLAVRWPALDRQIWNLDEGSTITMAQQVLDGDVLFRDAADNRTPLVPYVKALVLAIAGDWNTRAIHTALALMLGFTAVLLWLTCRRLGHESVGVFSALAFLGLSTGLIPPVDSLCAHTGWFLIFFSATGFWFFSAAVTRLSRRAACASGVSFGLAMLAKQPGLLDFGVTVVIVVILASRRHHRHIWRLLPWMLGGFLVPLAITVAYFHAHHAL
ncbi:MAG TPA: glycosyltransferase family 39 protein, partial [Lacunisphaera sp.]|nr:glycosyltransferase family 39 protein [Lacunisphaera sp.]